MSSHNSLEALDGRTREAIVNLLYRMADDELILGLFGCQWTGPLSEADATFSTIAKEEVGHAGAYYRMLHQLGEPEPSTLALTRGARAFRCASLVALSTDDWALGIIRQFLYQASESVRLTALAEGSVGPLAELTRKLRKQESDHFTQGRMWVLRLGLSSEDHSRKMQDALDLGYPHGLGLFEPTEVDETLAQADICPREVELCSQWESAVAPVLANAGLRVPHGVKPAHGGRVGRHPPHFPKLLDELRRVFQNNPPADW